MQALLAFLWSEQHGWKPLTSLYSCNIFGRLRQRVLRLRDGLGVSGVWLHIVTPIQTAALIAGYGLLTQGYGIAKLRHELRWQDIWPLTVGTAIGIPIGVMLLTHTNPTYLRFGVGVLLALYATYSLVRPPIKPMKISAPADVAIGISNGLLGGLTGLGGIISTISCQWRGWSRDKQRSVFQPVLFAAFVVISISQIIAGSYTVDTIKLYLAAGKLRCCMSTRADFTELLHRPLRAVFRLGWVHHRSGVSATSARGVAYF